MKFELEKFNRDVPDEDLISDMQRVAAKLGQNFLTTHQYIEHGRFNISTPTRRFGTWSKACLKAGLQNTKKQRRTYIEDEELFQNIEEMWMKLGRQPRCKEMAEPFSKHGATTYINHFGTWTKALESFIAYINKESEISSEEGIRNLQVEPTTKHKTRRDVNLRLRHLVMSRDNFKCQNCGKAPATEPGIELHVDHIKAWTNGGETVLENLQTLCSKCNYGKSNLE